MFRVLTIALGLAIVCYLTACCRQQSQRSLEDGFRTEHTLTWDGYDGISDDPSVATYLFDGVVVGVGATGISILKGMKLEEGSRIRIITPFPFEPGGPNRVPPYAGSRLVKEWERMGYRIEYAHRQEVGSSVF